MRIVFLEANHDATTKLYYLARRIVLKDIVTGTPHSEFGLYGAKAISKYLVALHTSVHGFRLISAMGHGEKDEFCGQNDLTVYDTKGFETATFVEAIVHLFSCNCGKQLGAYLVKSGALAFVGYEDFVSVGRLAGFGKYFVREGAAIDKAVVAGKSAKTAKAAADAEYASARVALAADPSARPSDLAELDSNHSALVGPWTGVQFGKF